MLGLWNVGGWRRPGGDAHAAHTAPWSVIALRTAVAGAVLAGSVAASVVAVDRTRAEHGRPPAHSTDGRFVREITAQLTVGAELAQVVLTRATDPAARADATAMLVQHEADLARISGWLDLWDKPGPLMHTTSTAGTWSKDLEALSRADEEAVSAVFERLRRRHDAELLATLADLAAFLSRDPIRNLATHLAAEHRRAPLDPDAVTTR